MAEVGGDRLETIVESRPARLDLTEVQARQLRELGRYFASRLEGDEGDETDGDQVPDRTIISCRRDEDAPAQGELLTYHVFVDRHVGVISVPGLTIAVHPKISFAHFAHVTAYAIGDPRLGSEALRIGVHESFHDLVARWYLNSVDRLIPNHLIRDYYEHREWVASIRGSIELLETTNRLLSGALDVRCRFDEFELDHALNRLLKEACRRVAMWPTLPPEVRAKARAKFAAMDGIGPFERADLGVRLDRRATSEGFGPALALARSLVAGEGRSLSSGDRTAIAFLQYTPRIIEDGLRRIIAEGLAGECRVSKRSFPVEPVKSADPDLVFESSSSVIGVGDVKHKVASSWQELHGDLYQSVYFAAAARVGHSLITAFTEDPSSMMLQLKVGDHHVRTVLWDASPNQDPRAAQKAFVAGVYEWVEGATSASLALT